MNPRPTYIKLRDEVKSSGMTWEQLKSKDWQFDIDALLTTDEKKALKRYEFLVIRWLKGAFKEDQYTGTLKAQLFSRLDEMAEYLETHGLSDDTGEEKLDRAYSEWKEARNG